MSKCLNSQETGTIGMVEIDVSKDVTILENTVLRLAGELGIPLKETEYSGISYKKEIEGRKKGIEISYIHDAINVYECFTAERGEVQVNIFAASGKYDFHIRDSGKNLLSKVERPESSVEKRINLRILCNDIRDEPEKIHDPLIELQESELNLITARTILKYLS
jgi:hypothetical protein